MKKFLTLLLVLFVFSLFIISCDSDLPILDSEVAVPNLDQTVPNPDLFIAQSENTQASSRKANNVKVKICHLTGNGEYNLIEVNQNAVAAHLAHGDIAHVYFLQGFEDNADGWFDINSGWYGTATRVSSGPNGITSSVGDWHAIFEGDDDSAPFTRFDGYVDTWPGTWSAELDVYLDPTWGTSQGFDYSVAATGSDGAHQRDFIFHVNNDASTGKLLVAGSNNTNFAPREDLENINHYEVTAAGWYTLQHMFYDDGGALAVDLNILDSGGNILFTETRSDAGDVIATEIGGNRYGWFTFINVDEGIGVDEQEIFRNCAL
jgi:hypothetical protein